MQTILGAGGPIGTELARALREYTSRIRLVSRKPEKVNPEDELFPADLRKWPQVKEAVKGSEVVYLTAGLPYKYRRWKKDWPVIVRNVIKACEKHDCKLVFFDNVYMYSRDSMGHMTEKSMVDPPSKKGRIRAEIAEMIMKEVWTENLQALIARSADFYGPGIEQNSILIETVFKPIKKNKRAMWLGNANCKHSFTFTPDAAKATAFLGNKEEAYGQVWHLPTAQNPPTGKQWVEYVGKEMNAKTDLWEVPKWMVRILGIFMPVMRETVEMMYQYNRNYVFDSSKIEEQFGLKPTSYKMGIREIVKQDFKN
ncbi:NAD-dependent epimerase/dehydratase family protein [Salinimicrobium soli]|uniref:NAD-dependent epimerase/dehydratase family protein n=1 Tax=Salinimicrobium soli TaxID=1254399 RepID=UPI003AB09441